MNDLDKIKNTAGEISPSPEEKEKMRASILHFVRSRPARAPVEPFLNFFTLNSGLSRAFAGALCVLGISGGISFAAEGALPGDLLYPVKIAINEEIRGAVVLSAGERAKWESERLTRRLEEAEELAHKKEFNAEARAKGEENFKAQAERVEKRITDFESSGENQKAADLRANPETSLGAHEKILEKMDGEEVTKFLPKVREKKENARLLKEKSETRLLRKTDKADNAPDSGTKTKEKED